MRLLLGLLGWAWILFGIWWIFRPQGIRKRLEKKFRRTARWILFVVLFATAGIVFSAGRQIGGLLGTLLAILAVIAILKALLFARGQVSDRVLDWWGKQPDSVYRASAAALLALGCLMQWLLYATSS